jgi:hypothetical protein
VTGHYSSSSSNRKKFSLSVKPLVSFAASSRLLEEAFDAGKAKQFVNEGRRNAAAAKPTDWISPYLSRLATKSSFLTFRFPS